MAIAFLGIDLAKNVLALHGVDESGKPALVRQVVRRDQLLQMVAALPPARLAWRPVRAHITGRAPSNRWATAAS